LGTRNRAPPTALYPIRTALHVQVLPRSFYIDLPSRPEAECPLSTAVLCCRPLVDCLFTHLISLFLRRRPTSFLGMDASNYAWSASLLQSFYVSSNLPRGPLYTSKYSTFFLDRYWHNPRRWSDGKNIEYPPPRFLPFPLRLTFSPLSRSFLVSCRRLDKTAFLGPSSPQARGLIFTASHLTQKMVVDNPHYLVA